MPLFDWLTAEEFRKTTGQAQLATNRRLDSIMSKISELAATLNQIDGKLEEAKSEIVSEIGKLKAALADVEVPADAAASLEKLSANAQALADIVPDPSA